VSDEPIEIERVKGEGVLAHLDDLARLRIEVFREFPYLYDGDRAAERDYLRHYAAAEGAVVVVAKRAGEVVGVSTGLPLAAADEAFRRPFEEAGERVGDWFYFGESVLRRDCRGRGAGHRFFDEREAHAATLGFRRTTFCAVVREAGHPLRPPDHRPHDAFWARRGYRRVPTLRAHLGWRQVDSPGGEVENELVFWVRGGAPQVRQM